MKLASKNVKRKIVPKLSALLVALCTTFFVVACGGGGSTVGSDGADSVKNVAGSTGASGASGTSGTSGADNDDDDDCTITPTPTPTPLNAVAKHGGIDDDDDDDDDDDEDEDDEKCATPLPPLTEAELAAGKLGKALWAANCFSCHGSDTHEVRTAARVLKAINENKGGMGALKGVISETDAANIAIYAVRPSAF
jgi:cytochrome c553